MRLRLGDKTCGQSDFAWRTYQFQYNPPDVGSPTQYCRYREIEKRPLLSPPPRRGEEVWPTAEVGNGPRNRAPIPPVTDMAAAHRHASNAGLRRKAYPRRLDRHGPGQELVHAVELSVSRGGKAASLDICRRIAVVGTDRALSVSYCICLKERITLSDRDPK